MILLVLKFILLVNIFGPLWQEFNKITEANQLKNKAEFFFQEEKYQEAIPLLDSLLSYYEITDEKVRLNLAHSYYALSERKKAEENYRILTQSSSLTIASVSFQQLGLIHAMRGKTDDALDYLKKALKSDPDNEIARYNFELIRKLKDQELERNQKARTQGKGNDKGGSDQKGSSGNQEVTEKRVNDTGSEETGKGTKEDDGGLLEEGETGNEKKGNSQEGDGENPDLKQDNTGDKEKQNQVLRRLAGVNISEEKAKAILEQMRNDEIQYIQQLKKQQFNKDYKNKPDW